MRKSPDLTQAYALETPEDSRKLYADWADTYDTDFAQQHDYILHEHVARIYVNSGGFQPVLDVGAGTGLCGAALRARGLDQVEATDISPDMLKIAETKAIYSRLFEGDVLARLNVPDETYAGVVSAGTFTHGHLGCEALDELLRVVRPRGWVVISVNAAHFESKGFAVKIASLEPLFMEHAVYDLPIYGARAKGSHARERALIAVMRKA